MTAPASRPAARPTLIHAILLVGSALLAAVLVGITAVRGPAAGSTWPVFFLYIPFFVAIPAVGVAFFLRQQCAPLGSGGSFDQWWSTEGAKALASWALLEGTAIVGAVFHMLTGNFLPLIVTGACLLLLALFGPDRLAQP